MAPREDLLRELREALVGALGLFADEQIPPELGERARSYATLHSNPRRPNAELVGRFLGALCREGILKATELKVRRGR